MRPEAAIILQFLRCLGNVTSWNIRLYTAKRLKRRCTVQTPAFNGFGLFFLPLLRCIRHSRNDIWKSPVIRIVGLANFRQIEHAGVLPESPGIIMVDFQTFKRFSIFVNK